ncbi:hypothetical protein L4D13_07770 [Photobacterium profundum]|uniref:hypothetical protein n=1 Tax=Photobacterium profundum TaxID=74109 RepID=UPI003D0EEC37
MLIIKQCAFLLAGCLSLVLSSTVFANEIYCVGKIEDWDLTRHGYFYVDGDWNGSIESQRFCSIEGSFDGISADICKVWISAVMTAQAKGGKVKVKYLDMPSCKSSDLGAWSKTIKAPEYIRSY